MKRRGLQAQSGWRNYLRDGEHHRQSRMPQRPVGIDDSKHRNTVHRISCHSPTRFALIGSFRPVSSSPVVNILSQSSVIIISPPLSVPSKTSFG